MILAMASSGAEGGAGALEALFVPLILMFAVLYFLMIRPQQKQQKKQREVRESLKSGDRVVTNSGIFGIIVNFNEKDKSVVLRVGGKGQDATKLEILRSSIAVRMESES